MTIRLFRPEDAPAVARLSAGCSRTEADFVLNPMWEDEEEFAAEFARRGISPENHLLVEDAGEGDVVGLSGFLPTPGSTAAGLFCPIVEKGARGQGVGGELLRAALEHGRSELGVELATAGIGTRNRAGYALLTAHGFRPVRQHFLMRCDEAPKSPRPPVAGVTLEPAEADDVDAILAIYTDCGFAPREPDEMRAIYEDRFRVHAVARHEGRVVAFTEIETHWPRRPWVAYVGVETGLRDRGLGSSLVAWTLARQFEAGARSALLLLSPANRTAIRAYEKVGFRRSRSFDVLEKGL